MEYGVHASANGGTRPVLINEHDNDPLTHHDRHLGSLGRGVGCMIRSCDYKSCK
jgi:hypothetical protein